MSLGEKFPLGGLWTTLLVSCWSVWWVLEIKAPSSWFCEWTSQGKLSPLPQVIRLYGDTNINKHCTGHSCIFCLCDFSSLWWQLILLLHSPKILRKDRSHGSIKLSELNKHVKWMKLIVWNYQSLTPYFLLLSASTQMVSFCFFSSIQALVSFGYLNHGLSHCVS